MWTDLVQAYESRIAVLEEARSAYQKALVDVIEHAGQALEMGVREGLAATGDAYRFEFVSTQSDDDATFAFAPWSLLYLSYVAALRIGETTGTL